MWNEQADFGSELPSEKRAELVDTLLRESEERSRFVALSGNSEEYLILHQLGEKAILYIHCMGSPGTFACYGTITLEGAVDIHQTFGDRHEHPEYSQGPDSLLNKMKIATDLFPDEIQNQREALLDNFAEACKQSDSDLPRPVSGFLLGTFAVDFLSDLLSPTVLEESTETTISIASPKEHVREEIIRLGSEQEIVVPSVEAEGKDTPIAGKFCTVSINNQRDYLLFEVRAGENTTFSLDQLECFLIAPEDGYTRIPGTVWIDPELNPIIPDSLRGVIDDPRERTVYELSEFDGDEQDIVAAYEWTDLTPGKRYILYVTEKKQSQD